ncbi:MAG: hypothetical protein NW200_01735 [Hyphomonadaceae bacterium]|nr:hypothetical protein [Hyphomonadaceae bacterium]
MSARISRRAAMLGAGAAAAVGVAGAGWAFAGTLERYVAALLRHVLRDEPLAPGAVEAFAAAYVAAATADTRSKGAWLARAAQLIGPGGVDRLLGGHPVYAGFKAAMVTRFLLGSTYFQRAANDEPVEFVAYAITCSNPFARLS